MIKIKHRINSIHELKEVNPIYGVEVDIRSYGSEIIINHEPFLSGDLFKEWIKFYRHKFLILNVKEEGLEKDLIDLMYFYKIKNYFFLDQSFPFMLNIVNFAKKNLLLDYLNMKTLTLV